MPSLYLPNPNPWGRVKEISRFCVPERLLREFSFRPPPLSPLQGYPPPENKAIHRYREFFLPPPPCAVQPLCGVTPTCAPAALENSNYGSDNYKPPPPLWPQFALLACTVILRVMMQLTMNPPPPQAVSINSCDSDARVAVFCKLHAFDPCFLQGLFEGDANFVWCVLSSSAASWPRIRGV